MNLNELKNKYEESLSKVQKRQGTIVKLCSKLNVNYDTLMKAYEESASQCDDFFPTAKAKEVVFKFIQFTNDDYDFDKLIEQLYDNLRKLFDVKRIASKNEKAYLISLNKFETNKIPAIAEFLKQWREKAYIWYLKNGELYMELKEHFDEKLKEFKKATNIRYAYSIFEKSYYSEISSLTMKIVNTYRKTINTEELNKVLDEEVENKYFILCERISSYVGEIKNAEYLSIGSNGELNGIVEGTLGKSRSVKDLARWCNNRFIFKSCKWEEYKKGKQK